MARKKVKVVVNRPRKPLVMGDFSKILFITKEADKDYKRSGDRFWKHFFDV